MGDGFLSDIERKIWQSDDTRNFLTFSRQSVSRDPFSNFIAGSLLTVYDRIWGQRHHQATDVFLGDNVRMYRDTRLARVSDAISSAISGLFPTLVILILYFVNRVLVRIGLVIVFTLLFSFALSIFTSASKEATFAATAAFAAVEVVFIGSTSTNSTV